MVREAERKMRIINKTDLNYKELGEIIDYTLEHGKEDTHYYGQIQYFEFGLKGKIYKCQIRYLKRYCEWCFVEKDNNGEVL